MLTRLSIETLWLQQRLVDDVRDERVPVAALVAQVTVLERLDDRRDQLIGQLRRSASAGMRPARTSPPVREVLLETLAHFRWPQNAGFFEEYLLARHQLQLDSRAFARSPTDVRPMPHHESEDVTAMPTIETPDPLPPAITLPGEVIEFAISRHLT